MIRHLGTYWVISGYFIIISLISRLAWSSLQLAWDAQFSFVIVFLMPLVLLSPLIIVRKRSLVRYGVVKYFSLLRSVTLIFLLLFFIQCGLSVPPILAADPNAARLDWGLPILHVLTEMCFRLYVLIFLSRVKVKSFFNLSAFVVFLILCYSILVVSRSLMLEICLYIGIFRLLKIRNFSLKKMGQYLVIILIISQVFLFFSRVRQGKNFDISNYGEMTVSSPIAAWVFGYTLVNFDNLYMVVEQNYKNGSSTNIFGPSLGFFQIKDYSEVDDYPYVGKFNLGTALRPFVLDFGLIGGVGVFSILWIIYAAVPLRATSLVKRRLALVIIMYVGLHLPMTSRMEIPTYFIPYLLSLKLVR